MAVQSVFQKLNSTIQEQAKEITDLKKSLEKAEETKTDLQKQIWCLEESVDDLEQYGRRNSLRFHNCPVHTGTLDTDCMVIDLCKDKLGIQLTEEDIFRSHPIGKPNRNGNIQIICRFKNWKVKNKVFSKKKATEKHFYIPHRGSYALSPKPYSRSYKGKTWRINSFILDEWRPHFCAIRRIWT